MKTTREWANSVGDVTTANGAMIYMIQQIQLDAMREGMRRAAELFSVAVANGDEFPKERVLIHAEQLTEKDIDSL